MRHWITCAVLALTCINASADAVVDAVTHEAAKQRLFQHLVKDALLPLVDDFANQSKQLAAVSQGYCAGQKSLLHVQAAWRDTQSAWQPLEMLQIGPVIEHRTQRRINAWPVRPTLLAPLLANRTPISQEQMEMTGAAGKGLPALEYLLFNEADASASAKSTRARKHCNLLQALAFDVSTEAQRVADGWHTPDGGFARQLAEAGKHPKDGRFANTDQALSDIVNLLIAGVDAVRIRKIGKPLEKSVDGAALERIESWRSESSLEHVRDNLRGFELLFFGAGKDGVGLDDYLQDIERPILVRNIREQLETTRKALYAIHPPLQQAVISQHQEVEDLHAALTRLQYLLETQLAEALEVDPGFNANDGD